MPSKSNLALRFEEGLVGDTTWAVALICMSGEEEREMGDDMSDSEGDSTSGSATVLARLGPPLEAVSRLGDGSGRFVNVAVLTGPLAALPGLTVNGNCLAGDEETLLDLRGKKSYSEALALLSCFLDVLAILSVNNVPSRWRLKEKLCQRRV